MNNALTGNAQLLRQGLRVLAHDPQRFSEKLYRYVRPMRAEYRRRLKMNLRRWLIYHHTNVLFAESSWMGVPAWKNPMDCWIYQEIIHEVKPDVIVEIGSAHGGSTLYLAHLMDLLGKGTIISVDIDRTNYRVEHERIITITGNSSAPDIVAKVSDLCRGKSVLVIHDGDHRKEQVIQDLHAYSGLVSVGSYLIVEDGIIDLMRPGDGIGGWDDGPLVAIDEFLCANSNFVPDKRRERYILTYNPKGFLKRVS